jgi:hypothetical protein
MAPAPKFSDSTREFTIPYDFDSDYLTLHTTRIVLEAARVAKAVNAGRIEVHGQRAATLLSNGRTIVEEARIGERRAAKMGENLIGLGLPSDRVYVTWQREADAPDGVADPERRRVIITLSGSRSGSASGGQVNAPSRASTRAACDRGCLVEFADQYLKALASGDPNALPLAAGVTFTENGARLPIGDGLWKTRPRMVTRRDVFADPTGDRWRCGACSTIAARRSSSRCG